MKILTKLRETFSNSKNILKLLLGIGFILMPFIFGITERIAILSVLLITLGVQSLLLIWFTNKKWSNIFDFVSGVIFILTAFIFRGDIFISTLIAIMGANQIVNIWFTKRNALYYLAKGILIIPIIIAVIAQFTQK